ncbi:hypothetical protein CASFOL_033501 [Castilleja foliolosa]|uniref:Uncharacterized protein n=1 Tax=Castilleja foliolosa TaxID=1961234 RepID=A0ABD3BZK2_9LAMI
MGCSPSDFSSPFEGSPVALGLGPSSAGPFEGPALGLANFSPVGGERWLARRGDRQRREAAALRGDRERRRRRAFSGLLRRGWTSMPAGSSGRRLPAAVTAAKCRFSSSSPFSEALSAVSADATPPFFFPWNFGLDLNQSGATASGQQAILVVGDELQLSAVLLVLRGYADVINSIVLQDDFLPRTTVALEDVYKSLFCFPCLLCIMCLKDTCTLEEKMLQDPRRLYAPGRLYHIIVRKPFRTAVHVDGRSEHIVLSCNTTSDHAIILIQQESERAFHFMLEKERITSIPPAQRMERQASLAKEHNEEYKAALERAIALYVYHAYSPPSYGTFQETEKGQNSSTGPEDHSFP